jgi:glutamate synthase (NADPH/NADH) large chain
MLKVMSKMGISTYQSYCGAQIFDAVGLSTEFVDKYFTGTATTIEGVGLREIAEETVRRHATPSATTRSIATCSTSAAIYAFRMRGEDHAWTPQTSRRSCSTRCAAIAGRSTRIRADRSTSRASGC